MPGGAGSWAASTHGFEGSEKVLADFAVLIARIAEEQLAPSIRSTSNAVEQLLDAPQTLLGGLAGFTDARIDNDHVALDQTMVGRLQLDAGGQLIAEG